MDKCPLARADFVFALHFCTGAEASFVFALSFGTGAERVPRGTLLFENNKFCGLKTTKIVSKSLAITHPFMVKLVTRDACGFFGARL